MTDLSPLTTLLELSLPEATSVATTLSADGTVPKTPDVTAEKTAGTTEEQRTEGYVYIVAARGWTIPRAVGHSTILYVGQSSDETRVKGLTAGSHSACAALQRLYWALHRVHGEVESRFGHGPDREGLRVWVHVVKTKTPVINECLALNKIVLEHGEMPPANSRWERWLSTRVVQHLATGQGNDKPPFWTTGPHFEGDHDASRQAAWSTWFHVYTQSPGPKGGEDADWIGAVGWVWTSAEAKLRGKLLLAANDGADLHFLGDANKSREEGLAHQLWGDEGAGYEVFVLSQETGVLGWDQSNDTKLMKHVLERLFSGEPSLRSEIQALFTREASRGPDSDKPNG